MEEILLEGNSAVLCNAHVEGDPEVLGVAAWSTGFHDRVVSSCKALELHQTISAGGEHRGVL